MGVQGWNWLLQKEGFLPNRSDIKCCSCSLWRDESAFTSGSISSRLTVIPKGSELHIDGNGLAFALHRVAYARHITRILTGSDGGNEKNRKQPALLGNSNPRHKSLCSIRKKIATGVSAIKLLPTFMPMDLLSDVTCEFVAELKDKHQMHLKVYWDGDCRRIFKAATDEKRQERQPEEWSNLQLYCMNGILPSVAKACELESIFPKCRFFQREIAEALRHCGISQIECEEEADATMAQAVSCNRNAYIVGEDSDFCFFPNVNYVPISTLDAGQKQLATGIVLRRDELAQEFSLPDEALMLEVAILMGNDYVNPKKAQFDSYRANEWDSAIDYVKEQGTGFKVASESEDVEEALSFVRALYQLEPLDEFELYDRKNMSNAEEDELEHSAGDIIVDGGNPVNGSDKAYRPTVPEEIPVELLTVDLRMDKSLKDAILRCLQAYVDLMESTESSDQAMLNQTHLDVFRKMPTPVRNLNDKWMSTKMPEDNWRPNWSDIPACYLIEKMIDQAMEQKSPMAHSIKPSGIFNQLLFLEEMYLSRKDSQNGTSEHGGENEQPPIPFEGNPQMSEQQRLPIDDHEDLILESIAQNRVTIIQGETGCGKSSRIPVMLLNAPPPDPALSSVKMFISQPRRIAAKGLVERVRSVEPDLGKLFALRLGHGLREYESEETRAWFCTTGYLVRLLANHPERFNDISHLIIDEIHDRGVDLDLLCLLCRRLLRVNSHLRLVLMSATLAAALFQQYFDVEEPPIQVGARRFPVAEFFLEDMIANDGLCLAHSAIKTANQIANDCDRLKCKGGPSAQYVANLTSLAAKIVASIGKGGISILIFVPGMNEIVAIIEGIEELFIPGLSFTTIPVHSDIPFEDQLAVFSKTKEDECRVIVATNSAESSVTLPALDHVIDLGLCRQIIYNEASHRQLLTLAWISKASATQRAGRTGRIRQGNVYRLYTRNCYMNHMIQFEPGEMLRIPLDSVILTLKGILPNEESATEILLECLEPPSPSTIERSLLSLHDSRFLTSPDDNGEITTLGSFVSSLGTDLLLGALIGLGIQFGVGPEAIQLAGALSFGTKPPWVISNRLLHGAQQFNSKSAEAFVSRCHFDSNLFSEPFAIMNLIWDYREASNKHAWCYSYCIAISRMKQIESSCSNLQRRVAGLFHIHNELLDMETPPRSMSPAKLTILRAIQIWVFHENMIEWKPKKKTKQVSENLAEYTIPLLGKSDGISSDLFDGILIKERHPFDLRVVRSVEQMGLVNPIDGFEDSLDAMAKSHGLIHRILSYAIEKQLPIICFRSKKVFFAFFSTNAEVSEQATVERVIAKSMQFVGEVKGKPASGKARGISERPCGKWTVAGSEESDNGLPLFRMYSSTNLGGAKTIKSIDREISTAVESCKLKSAYLRITTQKSKSSDSFSYSIMLNGINVEAISARDMRDIFSSLEETKPDTRQLLRRQEIVFPIVEAGPWSPSNQNRGGKTEGEWFKPLVECIPEGARIIYAIASMSRREQVVWLGPVADGSNNDGDDDEEEKLLAMHIEPSGLGSWTRVASGSNVFLPDLSVPAMAIPLDGKSVLQCCCANALDLRGGAMRVEGLTMLPPGRLFSLLCRICFGLDSTPEDVDKAFANLGTDGGPLPFEQREDIIERCLKAEILNERSKELGEELIFDCSFVEDLLRVFDGFQNGEEIKPWSTLRDNPFTKTNLNKGRAKFRLVPPAPKRTLQSAGDTASSNPRILEHSVSGPVGRSAARAAAPKNSGAGVSRQKQTKSTREQQAIKKHDNNNVSLQEPKQVKTKNSNGTRQDAGKSSREKSSENLPQATQGPSRTRSSPTKIPFPSSAPKLFIADVEEGQEVGMDELPSPNIVTLVLQTFAKQKKAAEMKFSGKNANWVLYRIADGMSQYFQAQFHALDKSPLVNKKGDGDLPEWIKQRKTPETLMDILECIPASFSQDMISGSLEGKAGVFFNSIDTAIRMECAVWLERQFRKGSKHWYEMSIEEMVAMLHRETKSRKQAKKGKRNKKEPPQKSATFS